MFFVHLLGGVVASPLPAPYVTEFDLDYAEELSPAPFVVQTPEDLGGGLQGVAIDLELANQDGALFDEAVFAV